MQGWLPGDDAYFSANGSSTITVSGSQVVADLYFYGSGYSLTGGTLDLTAGNVFINQNVIATISSTISGNESNSGGLNVYGGGCLILSGSNTYIGGTIVSGGTLSISADVNLGAISATNSNYNQVIIDSNAVLQTTATMTLSSSRSLWLNPTSGINVSSGTLTYGGVIQDYSGPGDLIKTARAC